MEPFSDIWICFPLGFSMGKTLRHSRQWVLLRVKKHMCAHSRRQTPHESRKIWELVSAPCHLIPGRLGCFKWFWCIRLILLPYFLNKEKEPNRPSSFMQAEMHPGLRYAWAAGKACHFFVLGEEIRSLPSCLPVAAFPVCLPVERLMPSDWQE